MAKYYIIGLLMWSNLAFAQQGQLYDAQEKGRSALTDEAEAIYLSILGDEPFQEVARYNLGALYFNKGDFESAATAFNESAKLFDKNSGRKVDAYYNAGNANIKANNLKEAIKAYTNALKVEPGYRAAQNNLAFALKALKQQEKQEQEEQENSENSEENSNESEQEQQENSSDSEEEQQNSENSDSEEQEPNPADKKELSEEEVQNLMKYLEEQEKEVQEELQRIRKQKSPSKGSGKDW